MYFLRCFLLLLLSLVSTYAEESAPVEPAPTEMEQATTEPSTGVPVSYEGAFVKMLLTLGGLVILIFLTVWLLRRLSQGRLLGGGSSSRSIKILEKRALSPKSVLYLIEVGGKQILIAESQLEVRRLETIDLELDTD